MLHPRERVVLSTLLPGGGPPLDLGVLEAGFEDFYAEFERTAVPTLRRGFKLALFVALWVAPCLIGRLPPLTRHDRRTRERALAALGASRSYLLRQMLSLLKSVVALSYGADRRVREAIGVRS